MAPTSAWSTAAAAAGAGSWRPPGPGLCRPGLCRPGFAGPPWEGPGISAGTGPGSAAAASAAGTSWNSKPGKF